MFSSAPRCQRIRCRHSARQVGISSVVTRHCIGRDHLRAERTSAPASSRCPRSAPRCRRPAGVAGHQLCRGQSATAFSAYARNSDAVPVRTNTRPATTGDDALVAGVLVALQLADQAAARPRRRRHRRPRSGPGSASSRPIAVSRNSGTITESASITITTSRRPMSGNISDSAWLSAPAFLSVFPTVVKTSAPCRRATLDGVVGAVVGHHDHLVGRPGLLPQRVRAWRRSSAPRCAPAPRPSVATGLYGLDPRQAACSVEGRLPRPAARPNRQAVSTSRCAAAASPATARAGSAGRAPAPASPPRRAAPPSRRRILPRPHPPRGAATPTGSRHPRQREAGRPPPSPPTPTQPRWRPPPPEGPTPP